MPEKGAPRQCLHSDSQMLRTAPCTPSKGYLTSIWDSCATGASGLTDLGLPKKSAPGARSQFPAMETGGNQESALGTEQGSQRGLVTDVSFHKTLGGLGQKFNNLYGPRRAQPTPTENTVRELGANATQLIRSSLHCPAESPNCACSHWSTSPTLTPGGDLPSSLSLPGRAACAGASWGCPGGSGADLHRAGLLLLADQVHARSPQCARGAARAAG